MERLTIKELAPYLPYELKFVSSMDKPLDEYGKQPIWTLNGISEMFGDYCLLTKENNDAYGIVTCKPLLRPLSSFNGYFSKLFDDDIDVRTFLNEGFITQENQFSDLDDMLFNYKIEWWPYGVIQLALKHHFDVFGLIERGLALPIEGKEVEGGNE